MKSYSVAKLKAKLSAILREVVQGHEVMVTDHNKPVAKLVPHKGIPPLPRVTPEELSRIFTQKPIALKKGSRSSVELIRKIRDEDTED